METTLRWQIMKLNELLEQTLKEGFSKDSKEWIKSEFPDATVKGSKVLIPMSQEQYDKGLAKLLSKFDLHCPENEKHVGKDWGANYDGGNAIITLD